MKHKRTAETILEEQENAGDVAPLSGIFTAPGGVPGAASVMKDYSGRQVPSFLCLMALAGGFGPPARSQTAAHIALDSVDELLDPGRFEGAPEFNAAAGRVLETSFELANSRLRETDDGSEQVSGATLTVVASDASSAFIGHVGNARAYLLTERGLRQLTSDHVEYLEAARTRLTRALGIDDEIETDILRVPLKAGEVLLLCSHGIYSALDEGEIVAVMGAPDTAAACRTLAETAAARGAGGDLTVAAWRVPGRSLDEGAVTPGGLGTKAQGKGKGHRRRWVVALLAVLIIAAGTVVGLGLGLNWFKPAAKKASSVHAPKARYVQGDVLKVDTSGGTAACYMTDYPGGPDQVRLYDGWKVRVLSTMYAGGKRWYRVEVTEGPSAGKEGYVKESFLAPSG